MNTPTHEQVAERAYQLWQDHGSPIGQDQDIWLEAERQLNHGIAYTDRQFGMSDLLLERLKSETAAEGVTLQQKKPAREVKSPAKSIVKGTTDTKTQFARSQLS